MGEYNIKELLNQASTGIINLNDYISKEDFKQQLYDYATTQGIEYQDFRALISNIGEDSVIENYEEKFHQAINDDLNMPMAMSIVWEVIKNPKKSKKFANIKDRRLRPGKIA